MFARDRQADAEADASGFALVDPNLPRAEFLRGCERFLWRLAPEDLDRRPVYVLTEDQLPRDLRPRRATSWGYVRSRLDSVLRRDLGDRWRGPGPVIVLCERRLRRFLREFGKRFDAEVVRRGFDPRHVRPPPCFAPRPRMLATALHELAHVLTQRTDAGDYTTRSYLDGQLLSGKEVERLREAITTKCRRQPARPAVPFADHEHDFIRAAMHLVHRANRAGFNCGPGDVVESLTYRLSPMQRYSDALGDEPERLSWASFATILDTPPPRPFIQLWQSDVRNWLLGQTDYDQKTVAALAARRRFIFTFDFTKESTVGTLQQVIDRQAEYRRQAERDYWALVRRVAAGGEEPDPPEVARIVDAAGRSIDDFAEDCRVNARRRELRGLVDGQPDLEKRAAEVRKKIEAEDAKLEKAEQRHAEAVGPLEAEQHVLTRRIREAAEARDELRRTVQDPELRRRLEEVGNRSRESSTRLFELREEIKKWEGELRYLQRAAEDAGDDLKIFQPGAVVDEATYAAYASEAGRARDRRRAAQRAQTKLAALREQLAAAEKQREEIAAEEREVEALCLEP